MTATYYSRTTSKNLANKVYCEVTFNSVYSNAADLLGLDDGLGGQFAIATDGSLHGAPALNAFDVVQFCYKQSTGQLWIGVNNSWVGGGDPSTDTLPTLTGLSGQYYIFTQANVINTPQSVVLVPSSGSWTFSAPTGAVSWTG